MNEQHEPPAHDPQRGVRVHADQSTISEGEIQNDDVTVVDPTSLAGLGKNSPLADPEARDPDDPALGAVEVDAGPSS